MSVDIKEIKVSKDVLGDKIYATVSKELEEGPRGSKIPVRVYSASTAKQRDFEIRVPVLRNSVSFKGRKEVKLVNPRIRIKQKRNVVDNSLTMDLVVYAEKLEVEEGK